MGSLVAIVGRPNVGKSTLFNRLVGQRQAIVDDISGVTRDRQYGVCDWNGKSFSVVDTGGYVRDSADIFEAAIRRQVVLAIEEADVLLFMVDTQTGITDLDSQMADLLRRTKKPVLLVVNKVDNSTRLLEAQEFYALGFEQIFFISSVSGSGTGEILDTVTSLLQEEAAAPSTLPRFAVVGQPNVGKSSLINALLGEERHIVTDIPGTTRDAIDTRYNKFGKEFILVDTAGVRKKSRVHEDLEFYSVLRSVRAIEDCDICILVLDATKGMEAQDMAIFRLAQRRNKGIVLLVNKWDLIEKETNTAKGFEEKIREKTAPFVDIPIVFMSVIEKQRIYKAIETAMEVYENRSRRIPTAKLNEVMQEVFDHHQPPAHRGHFIKIKFTMQLPIAYPAFAFYCNYPKHIKEAYRNYLENQLRKHYNFTGVPISIFFREK